MSSEEVIRLLLGSACQRDKAAARRSCSAGVTIVLDREKSFFVEYALVDGRLKTSLLPIPVETVKLLRLPLRLRPGPTIDPAAGGYSTFIALRDLERRLIGATLQLF